jgi:hypothetical protein
MESAEGTVTSARSRSANLTNLALRFANGFLSVFIYPLTLLVRGITWVVKRARYREAEISSKVKCPACGYRGSRLNCILTEGSEKAAIEHTCLMCGAKFYSKVLVAAEKWLSPTATTQLEKVRQATANQVL